MFLAIGVEMELDVTGDGELIWVNNDENDCVLGGTLMNSPRLLLLPFE